MSCYRYAFVLLIMLALTQLFAQPLRILVTTDMHGRLESSLSTGFIFGGAAEMLAYWKLVENYHPEDFLLISAGDNASGTALSDMFNGEPAIDAMNYMGYDVSAVGNHEFDYGLDGFRRMMSMAAFPFIAGNISYTNGLPYTEVPRGIIYEEQGVKVGLIGIALKQSYPSAGLVGKTYAPVVRTTAEQLRAQGAQVLILVSHLTRADLLKLSAEVADLQIPLMLGGHSHYFEQVKSGNTWIIVNGEYWRTYTRIDLDYDPETGETFLLSCKLEYLRQVPPVAVLLFFFWRKIIQ